MIESPKPSPETAGAAHVTVGLISCRGEDHSDPIIPISGGRSLPMLCEAKTFYERR
jgi:hypothetical protein